MTTGWLIDKSAIGRRHRAVDADAWPDRIERGLVRTELAELTVLHIDKDFELIAAFTGQPHERLELR